MNGKKVAWMELMLIPVVMDATGITQTGSHAVTMIPIHSMQLMTAVHVMSFLEMAHALMT
jgi:hypothetical protein